MFKLKNLPIKNKLIILNLFIVALVLLLIGGLYLYREARILRNSVSTKLHTISHIIGYNSIPALNFYDKNSAEEVLNSLKNEPYIIRAWIITPSNKIFASYRKENLTEEIPVFKLKEQEFVERKSLYSIHSIEQDNEIIGWIGLEYDLTHHKKILFSTFIFSILIFLLGMLLTLGISFLTHKTLSEPILNLVEAIKRVSSSQDLTIRVPEDRRDEFGILFNGFNEMLHQIHIGNQERDKALKALKESETKYRTLVESAKDGIVIIKGGRFVYANPAIEEIAGTGRDKLIGTFFLKWVDPKEREKIKKYYENRMSGISVPSMYETIFLNTSGEPIYAEVNAALIPYEGEKADLVIIRNINERKKAEEEIKKLNEELEERVKQRTKELEEANARLVELDRLKSMFLASMSHELRTPLNSIIGFTGLILMGMAGEINEEQRKQLTMVQSSANHLLSLINDILDISKIESDKLELSIEKFDLKDSIEEIISSIEPAASKKGLNIEREYNGDLLLESDKRRIKQVIMNLLSNAIKFTDKGKVSIRAKRLKEEISIEVSDTGIGIREEDLKYLFQPFQQLDMSATKRYEGTGLGLYLSKKLTSLLKGNIDVRSKYGEGSTFILTLPLSMEEKRNG
ncbi:MAG: ATP-binding protein [Thermoanaerobaculia bacterium]